MRILTPLLAVCLLGSALAAQQEFELYPGVVSFIYRGGLGTDPGEILQGVHSEFHRGIGGTDSRCEVQDIRGTIQDQDATTQEIYSWVIRLGTDTVGPRSGNGNLIARVGPMQTPMSTGPQSWVVTTSLAAPIRLPNCTDYFAFGIDLPPAPKWIGFLDGLSTHASRGDGASSVQRAHVRAEDHLWQLQNNVPTAVHPPFRATIRISLLVDNGVLQLGQGGDIYGMGGMFPAPNNPLTARTRFPRGGGQSLLYVATGRTSGIQLFPGSTLLYLGGSTLFAGSATVDSRGEAVHPLITSFPPSLAGKQPAYLQAAQVRGTEVVMTNTWKITP